MMKPFLILLLMVSFSAQADQNVLRWGADTESGAPFAFRDPRDPEKIIGFEVDIVEALGREMGRKPVLVQNQWDGLVPGLQAGNYDVIINGLEITEERRGEIHFSAPYYVTYEQLVVRKNTYDINGMKDLKNHAVGTLDGSLAQKILMEDKEIETKPYDDEINSYEDLIHERIDAVLLDAPIVLYYAKQNPKLKLVGAPISRLEYGVGIRKKDTALLNEVNVALDKIVKSGEMKRILEKWAMWNPQVAELWGQNQSAETPPTAFNDYLEATGQVKDWKAKTKQYISFLPMLGKGAIMTIEISILAMILAILVGVLAAVLRIYGPGFLSWSAWLYVEIFRGTPLLIQLYLIFYGLPHLGIKFSPFWAAIVGLGLNYGASEAENYRGGIQSVPKGQTDAGFALGMSRRQNLRHVVLPQAMRLVLPPVTNDFIALLKDSSLVSVITLVELTTVYGQLASTYFDYLGIGLLAAAMYFLIGLPFVRLSRWVEANFGAPQQQGRLRKRANGR